MSRDPVVRCLSSRRLCPLFLQFVWLRQTVSHPRERMRGPRGRKVGLPYGGRPSRCSDLAARRGYVIPRTARGVGPAGTYRVTAETSTVSTAGSSLTQGSRNSSANQTGSVTSWCTSVTRVTYVVVKWRHWSSSVTGAVLSFIDWNVRL